MSKFLNSKYRLLEAYTPGEQPKDMKYIKLNTNESPYPPSKAVFEAVNANEVANLRLYPDPEGKVLKEKLAALYGVGAENIFLSNGSDDILNFAFMAFCENGAVFPEITYGFYEVFAELHGVSYEKIPLCKDFTIDAKSFMNKNKAVFIANPNAPTGIALSLGEIERIVSSNPESVVVIDEAYVDFGGESAAKLTKKYDNLLVVMTYSKSRSMAGARLGFSIAGKAITEDLEKIKYSTNPYNINRLTMAAGIAAVESDGYYRENCKKIIETREFTTNELTKLGFDVIPSKANFIFAKCDKIGGEKLYLELKKRGILIRHFSNPKISEYNRITIGSPAEMQAFIFAVKIILGGGIK